MSDSEAFELPVWIDEPTGADRTGDILLGGVPVARGVLGGGGFFRLTTPEGDEHQVEGSPAAYWPDGSVKWLHLCGLVDLVGGKRNRFTLTPDASAPEGIQVEQIPPVSAAGRTLRVSGGALEVEIAADVQHILTIRRNGRPCLVTPGLSAGLVLVDPNGKSRSELDLVLTDTEPQVVVRTANRVVARLAGRFVKPTGRDAGELVLFIEVFREAAEIRLQPVFIYLGQPEEDLIEALTLTVHTPMSGEDVEYGFANDKGRGFWDVIQRVRSDEGGARSAQQGPRWPQARQVQLGSSFFVTEKRTGDDASWTRCVEGRRAVGWCHFSKGAGTCGHRRSPDRAGQSITAAMRYFWQEYPRSLTIDADAGTITFGLVPPEARPLDLRRYSSTIYGAPVYEASSGPFPRTHGATGIAKSNELMLRFDATGRAEAPERGLSFVHPARPMVPPEYLAETRVLGRVAPARPEKLLALETLMAECADFLVREREVRGWYGLMNFGDVMCAYYSDLDRWAFDEGGYAWVNTEHLPDYGLWLQALRSARADWLEAAIEMTRHNRDVDMYHRGMLKGLGTRHNVSHWGCQDKEWRVSMPLVKRLHYYLTADPWTAEVIRNTVAVYERNGRTAKIAPGQMSAFAGVLVRWEMDHDERDARTLRNLAAAIADAVRPDGLFTRDLHVDLATGEGRPVGDEPFVEHFFMNVFGGQHAIVECAELAGDEGLTQAIIRHASFYLEDESKLPQACCRRRRAASALVFLAHACRETGDGKYRDAIARALESLRVSFEEAGGQGPLEEEPHKHLAGMKRTNKATCGLGDILHQAPYGLDVVGP